MKRGGARNTTPGGLLVHDPSFNFLSPEPTRKRKITKARLKEYARFVESLDGVPCFPAAEIVVETINGELYEVGGNWRKIKARLSNRMKKGDDS